MFDAVGFLNKTTGIESVPAVFVSCTSSLQADLSSGN